MSLWIMLIVFCVMLICGFPIFMCLGTVMVVPCILDPSFVADGVYLFRTAYTGVDNTALLAIPLFIFSGEIMARGGISKRLLDFFAYLVGKKRGGIPIAVVLTSILYGAICGAGPVACAAVGSMAIPTMIRLGYKKEFSASLMGAGGGIGIIIPPSIPFITYGMMTGVSVGAMFTAGFIPGILIGICIIIYVYLYSRIKGEDREKILANYAELKQLGTWGVIKKCFFALLAPVIILGGIYGGITTPTEAAVISVVYSIIICMFVYRSINLKGLYEIMAASCKTVAGLGLMLAFALGIGRVFTLLQVPQKLTEWMLSTFSSKYAILIIIILVLLFIGMFMDAAPAVMIFSPLLLPVVVAYGVDPVHFGIILTVTISIGLISPPYGTNLFVASALAETPVQKVFKPALWLCLAYLVALAFITFIPDISLVLGRILGK